MLIFIKCLIYSRPCYWQSLPKLTFHSRPCSLLRQLHFPLGSQYVTHLQDSGAFRAKTDKSLLQVNIGIKTKTLVTTIVVFSQNTQEGKINIENLFFLCLHNTQLQGRSLILLGRQDTAGQSSVLCFKDTLLSSQL